MDRSVMNKSGKIKKRNKNKHGFIKCTVVDTILDRSVMNKSGKIKHGSLSNE